MNEKMSDKITILLNEANNPLPQIAIPARKKLKALIEAGETVFVDGKMFGYSEESDSAPSASSGSRVRA